jgi:c-di-GMP-binding flagellar brake protein YcgR
MADIDIIDGPDLHSVIEALRDDKTLVKLRIPARDFNHLTIVTDIRRNHNGSYLKIDYPNGFDEAVQGLQEWRFKFEYTGRDKLPYAFTTSGGELDEKDIWITFPDFIERQQKRDDFRLYMPYGVNIFLKPPDAQWKLKVVNLSRGGILGVESNASETPALFQVDDTLESLQIRFPRAQEHKTITIKKAVVRRVERDATPTRRFYAFQFAELDKQEEEALVRHLYDLQREFLRRRLPLDR